MDRDPDGPCLVGDGACNRLPDPPGRIRAKFVALAVVELLNRTDEANVTLLNHIQQGHATADVFLGYADHQPQVGFSQAGLRAFALSVDTPEVRTE